MKKLLNVILCCVLVLSMGTVAFADQSAPVQQTGNNIHNQGTQMNGGIQSRSGYGNWEYRNSAPDGVTGPWEYTRTQNCDVSLGREITNFTLDAVAGAIAATLTDGVGVIAAEGAVDRAYTVYCSKQPDANVMYITEDYYSNGKPDVDGHFYTEYHKVVVNYWEDADHSDFISSQVIYAIYHSTI